MTDDLVKRLRCYADIDDAVYHPWVYGEAADRIEQLETALREIKDCCTLPAQNDSEMREIAHKALERGDD